MRLAYHAAQAIRPAACVSSIPARAPDGHLGISLPSITAVRAHVEVAVRNGLAAIVIASWAVRLAAA